MRIGKTVVTPFYTGTFCYHRSERGGRGRWGSCHTLLYGHLLLSEMRSGRQLK